MGVPSETNPILPFIKAPIIGGNTRANFTKSHLYALKSRASNTALLPEEISKTLRYKALLDYLGDFLPRWNRIARNARRRNMQLGENPNVEDCLLNPNVVELARQIHGNCDIDIPGYALLDDKIEYAQRLLMALRAPGFKNISFIAETQWGKTMVLVMTALFHNLWVKNNGDDELCFIVNLRQNSPHAQTMDDFDGKLDLIANVTYRGYPNFTVQQANSELLEDLHLSLSSEEAAAISPAKRPQHVVLKRGMEGTINYIISMAKMNRNGDRTQYRKVTLLIDEADEASGEEKSVINAWMEGLKNANIQNRCLLCTATAWQWRDFDEIEHIEVKEFAPGYCGTIHGHRTPVMSMTRLAALTGIKELNNFVLDRQSFNAKDTEVVLKVILAYQKGILSPDDGLDGNPFNNEGEVGGCMLRCGDNASMAKSIAQVMRPRLEAKGITLLPYHEGSFKRQTIRVNGQDKIIRYNTVNKMVKAAVAAGVKQYCVIVIGAGRRADRFPKHCKIFLDFTEKFSTVAAMEQGTMGRASGWFRYGTVVLLTDRNWKIVKMFRYLYDRHRFKCAVPGLKPSGNAETLYYTTQTTTKNLQIDFEKDNFRHLTGLRSRLEDMLRPHLGVGKTRLPTKHDVISLGPDVRVLPNPLPTNDGTRMWFYFPVLDIMDQDKDVLEAAVKKHFGDWDDIAFLRPNQTRSDGKRLACEDVYTSARVRKQSNFIHVSIVDADRDGHTGGDDNTVRDARDRKDKHGNVKPKAPSERNTIKGDADNMLTINLHVRWIGTRLTVVRITVPLAVEITDLSRIGPVEQDGKVMKERTTGRTAYRKHTPISSPAQAMREAKYRQNKRAKIRELVA